MHDLQADLLTNLVISSVVVGMNEIRGNTKGLVGTHRYAIVNVIKVASDDINVVYEIGAEFV